MDVISAEKNGCLGGTATSGMVGPFMSAMDPKGENQVVHGFMDEFIRRMMVRGGAKHPTECHGGDSYSAYRIHGHIGVTPFDGECFKTVAEDMCAESGVKLLYHMLLVSCKMDGKHIHCAYFATKDGIYAIKAKVFIDCTGDADLCNLAGAPLVIGDENGGIQVSSLFFLIDGVDKEELDDYMAVIQMEYVPQNAILSGRSRLASKPEPSPVAGTVFLCLKAWIIFGALT